MDDILTIIRKKKNGLTKKQRIVAEYMLEHQDEMSYITLRDLSRKIGVTEITILNTCQALGFDGIMVGIMAAYNPKLVPIAAFFYAYIKEGAAILARSSDIPIELVNIIQAIIMMLVVAERFFYKRKHIMMVRAAEQQLMAQNAQETEAAKA